MLTNKKFFITIILLRDKCKYLRNPEAYESHSKTNTKYIGF